MKSSCTRSRPETVVAGTGIVGIGNPLAGDDGVGIYIVTALRNAVEYSDNRFFHLLENDLFEIADYLNCARHFIFIDAFIGQQPGQIGNFGMDDGAAMPSLHQTDIGSVMKMLQPLNLVDPFPTWEIVAISVTVPLQLGGSLSLPVKKTADRVIREMCGLSGER